MLPVALLAALCVVGLLVLYRPLLLSSIAPDLSVAQGVNVALLDVAFLVIVALSSALAVPVVGALLTFSLTIGPPAAARLVGSRPHRALALSVVLSLATLWVAIACSYWTNFPIGFFVGTMSALVYVVVRVVSWLDVVGAHATGAIYRGA